MTGRNQLNPSQQDLPKAETRKKHSQSQQGSGLAESGQGLVEYALVVALVAGIGVAALSLTGISVGDVFERARLALLGIWETIESEPAQEVMVSVLDADEAGIPSLRVYVFDDQGHYLESYQQTDAGGVARFDYDEGRYRFLVRHQLYWFWSDTIIRPQQSQALIRTGQRPFAVTVAAADGSGVPHLEVYVYTDDDAYTGVSARTDAGGIAHLNLVDGDFRFRADYGSKSYWSDVVPSSSGATTITINSCPTNQYLAEYYANNSLSGEPVLTRCESQIMNDWGSAGPGDGVPRDRFSARWMGRFQIAAGTYAFSARADDGIRVWLDGNSIIDAWWLQASTSYGARRSLEGGEYEVRMEYFENYGLAVAELGWAEVVASCPTNQYLAEYYNDPSLSGEPALTRCESRIDYGWGRGCPAGGVNDDNFSVRWTGRFQIPAGTYTFLAETDDGMRVWVDNDLILDAWRDQPPTEYRTTHTLQDGEHEVRVEYYERGDTTAARLRWD